MARKRSVTLWGSLQTDLERYLADLEQSNLAPSTRDRYRRHVQTYLVWLTSNRWRAEMQGRQLPHRAAPEYVAELKAAGWRDPRLAPSPATVNNVISAITDFCRRAGYGEVLVEREQVRPRADKPVLNPRDVLAYLRAAEYVARRANDLQTPRADKILAVRNRLLAELPYRGGLRVGEIIALDVDDVQGVALATRAVEPGMLLIRKRGSRELDRRIPLTVQLHELLRQWLNSRVLLRRLAGARALLPGRGGRRVSARTVHAVVAHVATQAGIGDDEAGRRVSPRVLRDTFAHTLMLSSVPVDVVAALMGTASIDTIGRSSAPTLEQLALGMDAVSHSRPGG